MEVQLWKCCIWKVLSGMWSGKTGRIGWLDLFMRNRKQGKILSELWLAKAYSSTEIPL